MDLDLILREPSLPHQMKIALLKDKEKYENVWKKILCSMIMRRFMSNGILWGISDSVSAKKFSEAIC